VAYEAKKPLVVTDILVAPPKAGEVRLKVMSNGESEAVRDISWGGALAGGSSRSSEQRGEARYFRLS
jgi:hypothetical protein